MLTNRFTLGAGRFAPRSTPPRDGGFARSGSTARPFRAAARLLRGRVLRARAGGEPLLVLATPLFRLAQRLFAAKRVDHESLGLVAPLAADIGVKTGPRGFRVFVFPMLGVVKARFANADRQVPAAVFGGASGRFHVRGAGVKNGSGPARPASCRRA